MQLKVLDTSTFKQIRSEKYCYNFDKTTGFFQRWGETVDDDPICAPGPEIADIEISSACPDDVVNATPREIITNIGCHNCGFCYKGSVGNRSVHMSLETAKSIVDKLPPTITQIAYGICRICAHPHIWEIFQYTRDKGIIPNVTVHPKDIDDETAKRLSEICGAVAVSINKATREIGYDAIKTLSQDYGMRQINIHIVLASETVDFIKSVINDIITDPRLSKLNAMVMLTFKDKAKTQCFNSVSLDEYKKLVDYCFEKKVRFGMDSCGAHTFLQAIKDRADYEQLKQCVEGCCACCFSSYINVFGKYFACSFVEGLEEEGWKDGIDVLKCASFNEVWNHPQTVKYRHKNINSNGNPCCYSIGE